MRTDFSDGLWPRLIADIGGTNARFALETAPQHFEQVQVLACKDYAGIVDAVAEYLVRIGKPEVKHAAVAIANPVTGDHVQMTNHHWNFSIRDTRRALGLDTPAADERLYRAGFGRYPVVRRPADTGRRRRGGKDAPKAVLGAGTGLGVSGLIPDGRGGYIPLAGEGGHVSFAPGNEEEAEVWRYARKKFGHVSAERLISGMGLELIHEALRQETGGRPQTAAEITASALRGDSPLCAARWISSVPRWVRRRPIWP